jgi:hypothetical protein
LVVLDEAGAVGIDDMKRLFDLAKDCRIVLSGDTGQHASVARGDALRILETIRISIRSIDPHPAATQSRVSQGR